MSSAQQGTVEAALDWAARMERGEVQYSPYIAALAEELQRLREENARNRELLGIHVDEDATAWDEVIIALRTARQHLNELAQALKPFAENWDLNAAKHMSLDDQSFFLIDERVALDMTVAIRNARATLDRHAQRVNTAAQKGAANTNESTG